MVVWGKLLMEADETSAVLQPGRPRYDIEPGRLLLDCRGLEDL